MEGLRSKVALVIGGAAGIGLASSRLLAADGAQVVIADRDGNAAARAAEHVRAAGGEATGRHLDFSVEAEVKEALDHVAGLYGRLNVMFSNVGVSGPRKSDVSEQAFDHVLNLNLKRHYFLTTAATPLMSNDTANATII